MRLTNVWNDEVKCVFVLFELINLIKYNVVYYDK